MNRISMLSLFLIICSLYAWSEEKDKPIVSVIPFAAKGDISEHEASTLTEQFEASLINTQAYTVIIKSEIETILREQETYLSLNECFDESCALEIGKLLYADTIFLGMVSKLGNKYIAFAKKVDIWSGQSRESKTVEADSIGVDLDTAHADIERVKTNEIETLTRLLVFSAKSYLQD